MSRSVDVYATPQDWTVVLSAVEAACSVQYALFGLVPTSKPALFSTVRDIPDFGVANRGDSAKERRFLVLRSGDSLQARPVPQEAGDTAFAFDQLANPMTITLAPGGVFQNCVIAGQVATASTAPESAELFQVFAKEIQRRFRKVRSYRVGPEALSKLHEGARLTIAADAPTNLDLREA